MDNTINNTVNRTHPAHPPRELALQLACGHQIEGDTAESIVERAEQYAEFLSAD